MGKPWMRWLLWLQCALLLAMLAGMVANKFDLLAFRPAFMTFVYAFQGVMVVTGLAMLLGAIIWWKKCDAEKASTKWTLVLGVLPLAVVFTLIGKGLGVPQIHNISTDLENPPAFNAAYALRDESHNSLDSPSVDVREQQRSYYTTLAPLHLSIAPQQAYDKALQTVEAMGWTLISTQREKLTIEAFEETTFFGFKDDVVIRVQAEGQGSRLDLRSVSRVGRSDLGANAKRIERFFDAFKRQ
jgi:uncharacterized protein (DUF1499 family)